jgi:hypothetical protein
MRRSFGGVPVAVVLSLAAGCGGGEGGDDGDDAGDDAGDDTTDPDAAETCEPPVTELPAEGPFTVDNVGLPATCVPGGLRDATGRWFVREEGALFNFAYPKIEGDCDTGFRRANVGEDDTVLEDDRYTRRQWSDGTVLLVRDYYNFDGGEGKPPFEYTAVLAMCALPDGTLAAVESVRDFDGQDYVAAMAGPRFGLKDAIASGITLVGETMAGVGGVPIVGYNLVIDGELAYVVGPNGFDIVDVGDPAQPTALGHLDGRYNDVKVARGGGQVIAYLSPIGFAPRTEVIDVTDPAEPVALPPMPEYSHSVFVSHSGPPRAYLATYTAEVPVYDISNPGAPARIGGALIPDDTDTGIHDLFADGDMIYANQTTAGMVAMDVGAGLDEPVARGRIVTSYSHASWVSAAGGEPIILHGDEGMTVGDGGAFMRVLDGDLASPTFVEELGRYQTRPEVGIHNIMQVGDLAFIAYYHDGVRIVDVSDPANPTEVAHYNTWNDDTAPGAAFEAAIGLRVVGDLLYVSDSLRGLIVLRMDPGIAARARPR